MNDKLRDLISHATTRVEDAKAARESERTRAQQAEQDRDAENFRSEVESVLGKEVLDAIGPVTFHKNFRRNYMTFVQDSRTFRLQQETGFLVELEENGEWLGRQFNLQNPDAQDMFLNILGTALGSK